MYSGKIKECVVSWWVCIGENEGFRQVGADIGVPSLNTSLQSPTCIPRPGRLFFRTELAFLNLLVESLNEAELSIISPLKANRKKEPFMGHPETETTRWIGRINVDPLWLTANMDRLNPPTGTTDLGFEFIAIAHKSYGRYSTPEKDEVYIMLIESQGDVARRLGVAYVSLANWTELRPICKDIILE